MNKIRIIDLLNKIANGEEVPKKIKYANIIYKATYRPNGDLFQYIDITNDEEYFNYYCVPLRLNDEVEIIEEDKKIEKLEKLPIHVEYVKVLIDKINEIIDHINKGD